MIWKKKIDKYSVILVVAAIILFDGVLWVNNVSRRQFYLEDQTETAANDVIDSIFSEMDNRIKSLNLLTELWVNVNNQSLLYSYNRFLNLIPKFYEINPGFLAINWIDWNGTIQWIYPYDTNLGALQKNIRYLANDEFNEAFAYAESTGNVGFSELIPFYQGGYGFTSYFPLIFEENITGYINGVFDFTILFHQLFESNESILGIQDYSMIFRSQDMVIYNYNENFTIVDNFVKVKSFELYQIPIQILIRPNTDFIKQVSYIYNTPILIVGIILAIVIGVLIQNIKKKIEQIQKTNEEKQKLMEGLMLKQKLNSLGTLAGGIAHDFNNLLSGIQGYTSLIELNLMDIEEKSKQTLNAQTSDLFLETIDYIDNINKIIENSKNINKQLLSFSQAKDVEYQIIDIHSLLTEVLTSFEKLIDKRIKLTTDYIPDEIYLIGDPSYFNQMFMNLLINARDSISGEGNIIIRTFLIPKFLNDQILSEILKKVKIQHYLKLHFSSEYDFQISIIDTGKGIPLKIQEKIYDPFFTTKKEDQKGTGLGLTIVHNFISSLGGNISFTSEEGKGTTFNLVFPVLIKPVKEKIFSKPKKGKNTGKLGIYNLSKLTILLIEDENDIRKVIKKFIQLHHASYYEADNGFKGFQLYKNFKDQFSLVILDINLPGMNGIEIYHKIKEINPHQSVLFITGYSGKKLPPMDEYDLGVLYKPFTPQSLIDRISGWFASHS